MNNKPNREITGETSRLLSQLDQVSDHSSSIRALARLREQLYHLERLTGPSARTRELRVEIHVLEQRLRDQQVVFGDAGSASFTPA